MWNAIHSFKDELVRCFLITTLHPILHPHFAAHLVSYWVVCCLCASFFANWLKTNTSKFYPYRRPRTVHPSCPYPPSTTIRPRNRNRIRINLRYPKRTAITISITAWSNQISTSKCSAPRMESWIWSLTIRSYLCRGRTRRCNPNSRYPRHPSDSKY